MPIFLRTITPEEQYGPIPSYITSGRIKVMDLERNPLLFELHIIIVKAMRFVRKGMREVTPSILQSDLGMERVLDKLLNEFIKPYYPRLSIKICQSHEDGRLAYSPDGVIVIRPPAYRFLFELRGYRPMTSEPVYLRDVSQMPLSYVPSLSIEESRVKLDITLQDLIGPR